MRIVYARYRLTGPLGAEVAAKLSALLAELQSIQLEAGKYLWAMGDVGERIVEGETLLFGRLGKMARESVATNGAGPAHSFGRQPIHGKKAACSNFFISPSNSIMVLEDKPLLPAGKFLKKFKQFWAESQTAGIDFAFLKDEPEVFAIINRWDKITAAKFDLAPTNTRPREDFAPLDNLIRQSKASRVSLKLEGGGDGLAADNSIIQQGVSLSAAGYGEFNLKGVEKDSKTGLNSESFLISNDLVEVDELELLAQVVLTGIRKMLMQINQPDSISKAEPT